jgi:dihydrofolate reductase
MWEMMTYWAADDPDRDAVSADFAEVWRAVPKYVVSTTLTEVEGATLLRDPEADVARLKEQDGGPLYVSGGETAARLAGLIDEIRVLAFPVIVAGGKPAWTVPMRLALLESRTFASGVVYSRYDVLR